MRHRRNRRAPALGVARLRMEPIRIQLFRPDFGATEQLALQRVIASGWVGRGALTVAFERTFAEHLGVAPELVLALPSATEGLFHGVAMLGLEPGDEVILPSISFIGAAQAIHAVGAVATLADVNPHSLNPDVHCLEARRTAQTKAVLLTHYGGAPCDMKQIVAWAQAHGIVVIEDSACSPASRLDDRACGTFGDFAVWSFDSMKMISTIEGGAIYVRDPAVMARLRRDCCLGMSSAAGHLSEAGARWWEFDIVAPGRRSLFNDASAALGLEQMKRLPEMLATRQRIHSQYDSRFAEMAGRGTLGIPPPPSSRAADSHYFYWVQIEGGRRDALALYLRDHGIYTSFRYFPLHRTTLFGAVGAALPGSDYAADSTLNLPCHSMLSVADVDEVADAVLAFLRTT